jgi:acetyltransferase-like isoleucine patch superfamily enzyme
VYDNSLPWPGNAPVQREAYTAIRCRHRIWLGTDVRFLRGAMVYADRVGEIHIGDGATICRYAVVQSAGGTIRLGARVLIGDFCSLYGQGGLVIGDDTMVADHVTVVPNGHTFSRRDLPVSQQPEVAHGIGIGSGAWIGAHATVLDGVTIGDGCVVGAGAVVTCDLPPFTVAVGVPARVVKERDRAGDQS